MGELRNFAVNGWVSTGFSLNLGQFSITTADNNGAASTFWVDGTDQTTNASAIGAPGRIGLGTTGFASHPLGGDMAEVIVYSTNLNSARRILVENYLQAKYNNSATDDLTIANDVYDGDTTTNGNFDINIAGIGQETDGDNWTAQSAGLIVQDVSFLQDDGDYLMFGHRNPTNGATTGAVPTTGDWDGINDERWGRHWYFERTDVNANGGLVDLIFDFSLAEMTDSLPAGPASNYRLLRRANPTGQFEDITSACTESTSYFDDQVVFRNVDVTCLGSNFTLGTIDSSTSPTVITLLNGTTTGAIPNTLLVLAAVLLFSTLTFFVFTRRNSLRSNSYIKK
jgi:hypothetical protein